MGTDQASTAEKPDNFIKKEKKFVWRLKLNDLTKQYYQNLMIYG